MNEKKLAISGLYDYYGALLSEKQKFVVEMYYNDDLSLSEIAESIGITRQGVRDQLKHAEQFLENCERLLGFAAKSRGAQALCDELLRICDENDTLSAAQVRSFAAKISELVTG